MSGTVDCCPRCLLKLGEETPNLTCTQCEASVHLACLVTANLPSRLAGDTFLSLVCRSCGNQGEDLVTRGKISWLAATLLALYNLTLGGSEPGDKPDHLDDENIHVNGETLDNQTVQLASAMSNSVPGKNGFFHWRSDICSFVSLHWSDMFGSGVRKKKTWQGSVSGCLSSNAGTLFESGAVLLGEQGWWRLRSRRLPAAQLRGYVQPGKSSVRHAEDPSRVGEEYENGKTGTDQVLTGRRERGRMSGCSSLASAIALKQARDSLSGGGTERKRKGGSEIETVLPKKSFNNGNMMSPVFNVENVGIVHENGVFNIDKLPVMFCSVNPPKITYKRKQQSLLKSNNLCEDSSFNCMETQQKVIHSNGEKGIIDQPTQVDNDSISLQLGFQNLQTTSTEFEYDPELTKHLDTIEPEPSKPYEVEKKSTIDSFQDISVNNLLNDENGCLQDNLGELDTPIFDDSAVDAIVNDSQVVLDDLFSDIKIEKDSHIPLIKTDIPLIKTEHVETDIQVSPHGQCDPKTDFQDESDKRRVLDRFQRTPKPHGLSLLVTGSSETTFVLSPFSGRQLKPYIRRDTESVPPKLKVLRDIQKLDSTKPLLHPLDFVYIQPNHVTAVNNLARLLFWPGIDVSEVLQYPDFSCVALYKRLCVGFAFLVPDTRWNESYLSYIGVHPDWRGAGVGTFMLYHLIQTNLGKDLTLHVSANNPAVLLYQKFGFKVEEFAKNFYLKYLPLDSEECNHALYLRLSR